MEFSNTVSAPVSLNEVVNSFKNTTDVPQLMVLNFFVEEDNDILKNAYLFAAQKHNLSLLEEPHFFNAGFDLFLPERQMFTSNSVNKTSFNVKCSAQMVNLLTDDNRQFYTGYYMYPRSSLSKTQLRLANNTGIIDAGYRGPLIGMFDCLTNDEYEVSGFTRLLQICAPGLVPIYVRVIDLIDELGPNTSRGEGGFGSTGLGL
jgi:dUTP pyrophosphatase